MNRDALHICAQNIDALDAETRGTSARDDKVRELIREKVDYVTILVPDESERAKFMLWLIAHEMKLTFNANVDCYTFETFEDYNTVV